MTFSADDDSFGTSISVSTTDLDIVSDTATLTVIIGADTSVDVDDVTCTSLSLLL
jgi:hypothetical protein